MKTEQFEIEMLSNIERILSEAEEKIEVLYPGTFTIKTTDSGAARDAFCREAYCVTILARVRYTKWLNELE